MNLWLAWLAVTVCLAAAEWFTRSTGIFVFRTIPFGTTLDVQKNLATLPDGHTVQLHEQLAGHEPEKLNWNDEPEVATVLMFAWKRLLRLGLLLPFVLWLATEMAAALTLSIANVLRGKGAA